MQFFGVKPAKIHCGAIVKIRLGKIFKVSAIWLVDGVGALNITNGMKGVVSTCTI